ncbi:MAG: hypothetical protein PHT28_03045, partial [Dehalococcoidales bacterium]|nr:hypothetical protein [Dehalococcoidales bacterium]
TRCLPHPLCQYWVLPFVIQGTLFVIQSAPFVIQSAPFVIQSASEESHTDCARTLKIVSP